ncbi:MAG: helix-turn-helix transcriptional regulator [Solobacterium sp.]|nr:helix-turn-helix transcriptional regulator [Solobacterium sp.]
MDQKLHARDLARLAGYTEYYLTEKYRKETCVSLSSYIRNAKIARAGILPETTSLPVSEISVSLSFNTPNYFIQCFRESEGVTYAQYRKRIRTQAK